MKKYTVLVFALFLATISANDVLTTYNTLPKNAQCQGY